MYTVCEWRRRAVKESDGDKMKMVVMVALTSAVPHDDDDHHEGHCGLLPALTLSPPQPQPG